MSEQQTIIALRDSGDDPATIAAKINANPKRYRGQPTDLDAIMVALVSVGHADAQTIVERLMEALRDAATQSIVFSKQYNTLMADGQINLGSSILHQALKSQIALAADGGPNGPVNDAVDKLLAVFPLSPAPITPAEVSAVITEYDTAETNKTNAKNRAERWRVFLEKWDAAYNAHFEFVSGAPETTDDPPTNQQVVAALEAAKAEFA